MMPSRKKVVLVATKSIIERLERLKAVDPVRYKDIKGYLEAFKNEYPITDKVNLHPKNADGKRDFVVDSAHSRHQITFAGWAEEFPDKHVVHIIKFPF